MLKAHATDTPTQFLWEAIITLAAELERTQKELERIKTEMPDNVNTFKT